MTIAVFCPHVEDTGGVREVVTRLAAAHVAAGHAVTVVGRQHGPERRQPESAELAGARLWRARMAPAPPRIRDGRALRTFLRRYAANALPLALRLRRLAPDVIATHCSKFHAPWVATLAAVTRRPIVVHLHNAERTADGPEHRLWARLLVGSAERVVAVSPAVAAYALALRPALAGRVDVVRNGLDPNEFSGVQPETRPHPFALLVARLSAQKGVDVALAALARMQHPIPLVVAGSGPDRRVLAAEAAALGVAPLVEFLGDVPRARVKALLLGASFAVMPSRFEGNPLVSLESMQAGVALVASDIPGLPPELVDGETGLLVPPEDPARLAHAMDRLAADEPMRRQLAAAARAAAARMPSWDEVAATVLTSYGRAACRSGRGHST